jgi:hypothetical protein
MRSNVTEMKDQHVGGSSNDGEPKIDEQVEVVALHE